MINDEITVGLMQRNFPLHPKTYEALCSINCNSIAIDSSPEKPVVKNTDKIRVVHLPDSEGFFPIALMIPLFREFLKTHSKKLFLIEGDFVLSEENIEDAIKCQVNTKALYVESNPQSSWAYSRREGLGGVLLRKEIEKILAWMQQKPYSIFRTYEGYADTFLWFAVSSESSGYSEVSTTGLDWIKVLHMTHDDSTRVTKMQRKNMKEYRERFAFIISLAMECNRFSI